MYESWPTNDIVYLQECMVVYFLAWSEKKLFSSKKIDIELRGDQVAFW